MISGLYQIVWIHGSVLILCSCPGKDQHFCFLFGHLLSLTKIAVRIADIQIVPNHDQNLIFPLDLPSISRGFYVSLSCWCLYITISFSVCQLFSENLSVFFIIICHAVSSVSECCVTALSIKCSASVWIAGVLHRKIFGCFWGRTFRYRASLLHVSNLEPVRIRLKKSSCFSIMKLWHG